MSEIVERVAQAIGNAFRAETRIASLGPETRQNLARAAIVAMRDPTDEMIGGACQAHRAGVKMSLGSGECPRIARRRSSWRAMIDEALR